MTSTQRTILVVAVAAAAVIGAGLYFAPNKGGDSAAGTVAPAARHRGETVKAAGSQPAAPGAGTGQQSGVMQPASSSPKERQGGIDPWASVGSSPQSTGPKQEARPEYKTQ